LHGAVHSLPRDNARGDLLHRQRLGGLERAFSVDRNPQRIDHATDELLADRHLQQPARRAHLVALVEVAVVAQDDGADLVLLEVQRKAVSLVRKFEQLAGHRVLKAVDLRDAVTGGDDTPDVRRDKARVEILQPLPDDF
jgi:hypothetical protein